MKQTVFLFNTLTRKKELFTPQKPSVVSLYTCGPTVYNYAHVGNLRTYIFEDILQRVLEYNGNRVERVLNITDVGHLTSDADLGEDKMEKGAQREGKTVWDIAKFYTNTFFDDLKALNCTLPDEKHLPRATDYVPQMIKLIQKLEKKGFTYTTSDGIYFDTEKFPQYPDLARLDLEGLQEGARVTRNDEKKNPTDFSLWKFSPQDKQRQMEWESPWGMGFPGWHIECSAMAMALLGETIDIHCGAIDHVPIHHTNEIAQSEAASGKLFARYWVHGEWLVIGSAGDKMSKSSGNFITLKTVQEHGFDPVDFRYLCLMTHYRSKLNFSWDSLQAAKNGVETLKNRLNTVLPQGKPWSTLVEKKLIDPVAKESFLVAVNNDLNMPQAMDVVGRVLKSTTLSPEQKLSTLADFDSVLGLNLLSFQRKVSKSHASSDADKPHSDEEVPVISDEPVSEEVVVLINERYLARKTQDWKKADEIRDELKNTHGVVLEDSPSGVIVKHT